ncbi:hypothetical protein SAMD00019534_035480, partial [Acytostelium subglobosum LB1]|uniref:hypothetical protein n=1 Tax=Acytostelium subglobosum LB1 TaxID=1410327 RepID=UPI00064480BB
MDTETDYSIQCPMCSRSIHATMFQDHYNHCLEESDHQQALKFQEEEGQHHNNVIDVDQPMIDVDASDYDDEGDYNVDHDHYNIDKYNDHPMTPTTSTTTTSTATPTPLPPTTTTTTTTTTTSTPSTPKTPKTPMTSTTSTTSTSNNNNNNNNNSFVGLLNSYLFGNVIGNAHNVDTSDEDDYEDDHHHNNNLNNNNNNNDNGDRDNIGYTDVYVSDDGSSRPTSFVLMSNGELDDEYKSLMLAKQLQEDERKEKLAQEEEENKRLVLEMLEQERLSHEQEMHDKQPDFVLNCICCNNIQAEHENVVFLDACGHVYCRPCLKLHVMCWVDKKEVSRITCQKCSLTLSHGDITEVLDEQEYSRYHSASLEEVVTMNQNYSKCPSCSLLFEKINDRSLQGTNKEFDENGKELTKEAIEHKNKCRLRCPACSIVFCADCRLTPYHLGFTCDQYKTYSTSKHCRFCQNTISGSNNSVICSLYECTLKFQKSCKKTLPCGHHCNGIDNESNCLPCLVEECQKSHQISTDFCNICWIEDLAAAPCIKLECGHIFHYECCQKKLVNKWNSSRISFGFMKCALCQELTKHVALKAELDPLLDLYNTIKTKGLQRLTQFGPEKDVDLKDPKCRWYKKEEQYVMDRFSYFPCYKCKKPYFGGEKACGENNVDFKAEELLCGGCSCDGKDNCAKHGKDYVEYKCKFCCNMSVFFCWGKTHFCDDCHKKSTEMVRTAVDKLPKCSCNLKHPPNGEEHCFGCSICRMTAE